MGEVLAGALRGATAVTHGEMAQAFRERLAGLAIELDGRVAERLARYQALLWEWNGRMNLTADASPEATLDRHFMDSLAPLALKGLFPDGARLIDVGAGAGFPGLALAIARPDLDVLLLDSLQKRIGFLDAVVAELGLANVRTRHARAEDGAHDPSLRERFDVAAARAVAIAPVLMELLLPFVRVGGWAVCYKGPAAEEEVSAGNRAALALGGGPLRVLDSPVPGQPDWKHCVLLSDKRAPTPARYPRKAGVPAKQPLGTPGA